MHHTQHHAWAHSREKITKQKWKIFHISDSLHIGIINSEIDWTECYQQTVASSFVLFSVSKTTRASARAKCHRSRRLRYHQEGATMSPMWWENIKQCCLWCLLWFDCPQTHRHRHTSMLMDSAMLSVWHVKIDRGYSSNITKIFTIVFKFCVEYNI